MEKLLTVTEAARATGRSEDTIRSDADRGTLEVAARTGSGMRLFHEDAVKAYGERLRSLRLTSRIGERQ